MSFGYAILIRHVLAQPEVRKVEAGAPWAVWSATRAWNFCGVHKVTKVENSGLDPSAVEFHRRTVSNFHGVKVVDRPVTVPLNLHHHILSPVFRYNHWKKIHLFENVDSVLFVHSL